MSEISMNSIQRMEQLRHKIEWGTKVIDALTGARGEAVEAARALPDPIIMKGIVDDLDRMAIRLTMWMTDGEVT